MSIISLLNSIFSHLEESEFSTRGKLAHGQQELILSRIPVDCRVGLNT